MLPRTNLPTLSPGLLHNCWCELFTDQKNRYSRLTISSTMVAETLPAGCYTPGQNTQVSPYRPIQQVNSLLVYVHFPPPGIFKRTELLGG
jgi:hypothetical protein